MSAITMPLPTPFNVLDYFERLKDAGVPEKQAKVQTEVLQQAFQTYEEGIRKVSENTAREISSAIRDDLRDELASKGDIRNETNLVRADLREEATAIRADVRETELRLQKEIQQVKYELIKWYIGMAVAQTGVLAALYAIVK